MLPGLASFGKTVSVPLRGQSGSRPSPNRAAPGFWIGRKGAALAACRDRRETPPYRPFGKRPAVSFRAPMWMCGSRTSGEWMLVDGGLVGREFRIGGGEKLADVSVWLSGSSGAGVWCCGPNALANGRERECSGRRDAARLSPGFVCVRIWSGEREVASDLPAVPPRTVLVAGWGEDGRLLRGARPREFGAGLKRVCGAVVRGCPVWRRRRVLGCCSIGRGR